MFKPLNNRVLIKPDKAVEKQTSFGIILPSKEEKPGTGEVVVGNKEVKKGERILFSKFGFDEVEINKELHYVVSSFNILGVF